MSSQLYAWRTWRSGDNQWSPGPPEEERSSAQLRPVIGAIGVAASVMAEGLQNRLVDRFFLTRLIRPAEPGKSETKIDGSGRR